MSFHSDGIYARRWQWWYPWGITRWWRPRCFKGGDEWCNDSAAVIIPALGGLVVFWRRHLRELPCPQCWASMDDALRADYAPCGQLHAGRYRKDAHHHGNAGTCAQARAWLDSAPVAPFFRRAWPDSKDGKQ